MLGSHASQSVNPGPTRGSVRLHLHSFYPSDPSDILHRRIRRALTEIRFDPVPSLRAILLLSSLDTTGLRGRGCKGDDIEEGGTAATLASSNDEPIQTDQKIPTMV